MPSSQIMSSQSDEMNQLRPPMPDDLFMATIQGNKDVLISRLGLQSDESEIEVIIEASHSSPKQVSIENLTVHTDQLQSETRSGDTVLHLLVTNRHYELALMVFKKDRSLLKAKNKMLETPLHGAARAGTWEVIQKLIRINPAIVKDALEETNEKGDTALHVATEHGHVYCGLEFMLLNQELLYKVNNEMLSPIHIAITKGYPEMLKAMLDVDPTLGCTQFPDEVFPVHLIALTGNTELVIHFMEKYPDYAELLDSHGRNLFHIAAQENQKILFSEIFTNSFSLLRNQEKVGNIKMHIAAMKGHTSIVRAIWQRKSKIDLLISRSLAIEEMAERMNNAVDYEGNTPMHIAAMKGHTSIVRTIWENNKSRMAATVQNNKGLTPFEASLKQLREDSEREDGAKIRKYLRTEGHKFTKKWFDYVAEPPIADKWEKIQVIGLGSVLITTVTFAAAFTIPGGYDQEHGTPVLGRKQIFRTFIVANSLAFIEGFLSLFVLLRNAMEGPTHSDLAFAIYAFILAASSMVVAFGLGMYVTLAPISLPLAIIILVSTMLLALCYVNYIRQIWIPVFDYLGQYMSIPDMIRLCFFGLSGSS